MKTSQHLPVFKGAYKETGEGPSLRNCRERECRLDSRKEIFAVRVAPRLDVDAPTLSVFKARLDEVI